MNWRQIVAKLRRMGAEPSAQPPSGFTGRTMLAVRAESSILPGRPATVAITQAASGGTASISFDSEPRTAAAREPPTP